LSKLDKIAVLLVIDLNDAPRVGATANLATIGACDLVVGTNNSEGNLGHDLVVLSDRLLIIKLVSRSLEDLDAMMLDIGENLDWLVIEQKMVSKQLTRDLKAAISSSVRVSALAMTGIRLTLVWSRRMTSMSRGFREWPVG
jgi:hypothetical protein